MPCTDMETPLGSLILLQSYDIGIALFMGISKIASAKIGIVIRI